MQKNVYQEQIARLKKEQDIAIIETEGQISKWETFKSDYEALKQRLTTLPDQVSHDVMVPFGKMAFMPGKLVHSNEILVLLGDNWFAERSAKQAVDIVNRRVKEIDKQLTDLDQQRNLIEPRRDFTSDLQEISKEGAKTFEIREDYDEENEKKWKEQHKEQVKKYRQKLREDSKTNQRSGNSSDFDEKLWARLDDLERKEREGKEMQNIGQANPFHDSSQYPWKLGQSEENDIETKNKHSNVEDGERTEDGDEEYSETTDTSDNLDSDDEESLTEENGSNITEDNEIAVGGKVINFIHTTGKETESTREAEETVIHPGMLYSRFYASSQPKSILKKTVSEQRRKITKKKTRKRVVGFDTGSDTDEHNRIMRSVQQCPSVPAFTGTVLEKPLITTIPIQTQVLPEERGFNRTTQGDIHKPNVKHTTQTDTSKPLSRFKARKQNKTDS